MQITRTSLFDSPDFLDIGLFEARAVSDGCGNIERQDRNLAALPLAGVFAKHDAPGRQVLGTPSHAVFVAADTAFRISYPGGIGDRALTLRFGEELAPEATGVEMPTRLQRPAAGSRHDAAQSVACSDCSRVIADEFEIVDRRPRPARPSRWTAMRKEVGSTTGGAGAADARAGAGQGSGRSRRPRANGTCARLAEASPTCSPFHLCHVFRQTAGTSIYDYVLHERLAHALDAVLDGGDDLTADRARCRLCQPQPFYRALPRLFRLHAGGAAPHARAPAGLRELAQDRDSAAGTDPA